MMIPKRYQGYLRKIPNCTRVLGLQPKVIPRCLHLVVEPTVIQSGGYHDIKVLAPVEHLGADLRGLGIWETRQIVPPTAI